MTSNLYYSLNMSMGLPLAVAALCALLRFLGSRSFMRRLGNYR